MTYKNKKEIFTEISDKICLSDTNSDEINDFRISSLDNYEKVVEEIKTLKVIELDDFKGFMSYINYDHFIIFKIKKNYYFCDIGLTPMLNIHSMIKISDYKHHLRKDKIKEITNNSKKI